MVDIVIPLGAGSKFGDTEIRYCLRSIERNLYGYGNIYIIGQRPKFLKNIIFHEKPDFTGGQYRHHNIMAKIVYACKIEGLSDDFLFFNDDHYLLQLFEAVNFPSFYDQKLELKGIKMHHTSVYRRSVTNTFDFLKSMGLSTYNYDVHCPILMNKKKALSLYEKLEQPEYGYCLKSLYGNYNDVAGHKTTDLKINEPLSYEAILSEIEGRSWFSIGDKALNKNMFQIFETLYPNPSNYEK